MNRISALEIKKKEFTQKMRGADTEEVQSFLEEVSEEVEQLTSEKRELEERLSDLTARLDHFVSLEGTLERTLVAAQHTAIRMEEQAKKEAELILREAAAERDRRMADVMKEVHGAESHIFHLRSEYEATLARMTALLDGFSGFLKSVDTERQTYARPSTPLTSVEVATNSEMAPAQSVTEAVSIAQAPAAPAYDPFSTLSAPYATQNGNGSPFTAPKNMPSPFSEPFTASGGQG